MEKQEQEERKHIEALDRKIERLQEKVIKKHKEYSVLAEELSTLLDEIIDFAFDGNYNLIKYTRTN